MVKLYTLALCALAFCASDRQCKVQLNLRNVTNGKSESGSCLVRLGLTDCKRFVLKCIGVYDADTLFANNKYERECFLIKHWRLECERLLYVKGIRVTDTPDCAPVINQIHMYGKSSHKSLFFANSNG